MSKAVKKIFGTPKIKKPKKPPPPPPPPPPPEGEEVLNEEAVLQRERERKGRMSTILTSAKGLRERAPTRKKTLLGQ
jgi:hypothetical protein